MTTERQSHDLLSKPLTRSLADRLRRGSSEIFYRGPNSRSSTESPGVENLSLRLTYVLPSLADLAGAESGLSEAELSTFARKVQEALNHDLERMLEAMMPTSTNSPLSLQTLLTYLNHPTPLRSYSLLNLTGV
jgi:hypothetical protein